MSSLYLPSSSLRQRPQSFELDHSHPLARGLVFAGLGRVPHSLVYRDSSLYGNHGTLTNMAVPATATSGWAWDNFLGRWATRYDGDNDYVSLGTSSILKPTGEATWAAWTSMRRPSTCWPSPQR